MIYERFVGMNMEIVQLKDLTDIYLGVTHTPEYVWDGVPFLSVKDISGGNIVFDNCKYISEEEYNSLSEGAKPKVGDMLFCRVGTIGKPIIIPEGTPKFGSFVSLGYLRNKDSSRCKLEYLKHWMNSKSFFQQVQSNVKGASQVNLNTGWLSKFEVPLPELNDQCHIVEILNKCEEVINIRNLELYKLDELIKARFVEMFGDPKINERNWETGIVSGFYAVKGGKRIPKGMGYADDITEHPYLRATDMKNETIIDDDIHYIDTDVFEKIKRYTVNAGDIYLTNVGVNLGMAGVIPDKYDGANLTENAVKLVPTTKKVLDGLFLAHYINSPGIQDYINERKMAVGVPKLAIFRIETMPLIIPPLSLQIEFINFCKQVDKSKVAVQKALDEAQLLFDSLMQKYFG